MRVLHVTLFIDSDLHDYATLDAAPLGYLRVSYLAVQPRKAADELSLFVHSENDAALRLGFPLERLNRCHTLLQVGVFRPVLQSAFVASGGSLEVFLLEEGIASTAMIVVVLLVAPSLS